jgi:phosphomannomutase
MLPWLRVLQAMQQQGLSLGALVRMAKAAFPISGERNRPIHGDSQAVMQAVQRALRPEALETDWADGLSMTFAQWRFNLRPSNTEPLLRLNVETRGDPELLQDKVALLDALLEEGGGAGVGYPAARACHG